MGSCGGAAVGVIAELVNMHATLSIWVRARDVVGDGRWRGFGALFESHGACDLRVSSEHGNCGTRLSAW